MERVKFLTIDGALNIVLISSEGHVKGKIASAQFHGFSDASENAYAGMIYLPVVDSEGEVHISLLVTSKTRVAPMNRLTIPRLELLRVELTCWLNSSTT